MGHATALRWPIANMLGLCHYLHSHTLTALDDYGERAFTALGNRNYYPNRPRPRDSCEET